MVLEDGQVKAFGPAGGGLGKQRVGAPVAAERATEPESQRAGASPALCHDRSGAWRPAPVGNKTQSAAANPHRAFAYRRRMPAGTTAAAV